jgi:threonine aldolase
MEKVDLRSDTVTLPTREMRTAAAEANLGDDVYGEDPAVNELEAYAAELLKKEAALFVPSGTMGNLIAFLTHCQRGDEVIVGDKAHTFLYEVGGMAALGGIQPYTIPNQPDGTLRIEDIQHAVRGDNVHFPRTRLVSLENTHNRCGGAALTVEYTRRVGSVAREYDLKLHLDGARIFNAAAVLGVPASELVAPVDSVMFCLSKGLAAPVGSILAGSGAFIRRARKTRKQLGGGMRQAGLIAAPALLALRHNRSRLGEDHLRAKKLAEGLRGVSGLVLDENTPLTNMVYVNLEERVSLDAAAAAQALEERGVLVGVTGKRRFRLVTHYWITDSDLEQTVQAFREVTGL